MLETYLRWEVGNTELGTGDIIFGLATHSLCMAFGGFLALGRLL